MSKFHPPHSSIDNAMSRARLDAGYTQAQLGRMAGLSQVMVCVIERRGWCWEWQAEEIESMLGDRQPSVFDRNYNARAWVRP